MYTLWKESIKEGKASSVGAGAKATSNKIKVIREVNVNEIKEGDEVYIGTNFINFIKTSPVLSIDMMADGNYKIETQTSIYRLELNY